MSLVDVLLSNKQVMLSLVMVGGILLFALTLAVGPSIFEAGKQIMARRKAKQAALRARKIKAQRKRAALAKARARAQAANPAAAAPLPPGVRAVYPGEEELPVAAMADASAQASAPESAAAPVAAAEAADVAAAPEEVAEAEENAEAKSGEFEPETDLQNLLNSVFTNDEQNERFAVLLRDTEVISAETLLALARKVAADLGASSGYPAERQPQ